MSFLNGRHLGSAILDVLIFFKSPKSTKSDKEVVLFPYLYKKRRSSLAVE